MVHVERLTVEEWALLREVRLRALADAPASFASSHEREAGLIEAEWRGWLGKAAWFVARDAGRPIGLVGGIPDPAEWFLISMWVAPEGRGSGVAARLIGAVVDAAAADRAEAVALRVNEHNAAARRVYERFGFVATGEWETLPRADAYRRERMRLPVAAVSTHG
ncbi:GNAT family N-acetyltransferase [Amycolatopsis anabasis]|uniref:GNAT family N-acetyltransferase n=1 Tax=Amycolatopsis anabasis TaxID=1840409 RepID=UPI00131B5866|nr:GNAT family N-acetyltransferase [Amycolatopsis anabasis]